MLQINDFSFSQILWLSTYTCMCLFLFNIVSITLKKGDMDVCIGIVLYKSTKVSLNGTYTIHLNRNLLSVMDFKRNMNKYSKKNKQHTLTEHYVQ